MTETNHANGAITDLKKITVHWDKFVDGVGMVFAGVHSMLEALDASKTKGILNESIQDKENSVTKVAEDVTEKTDTVSAVSDPFAGTGGVKDELITDSSAAKRSDPETETPSVTQDDITKIIVQKLKKNRSNNEKIGAILKTYGVAKVSELSPEKYEAFLTDLSQL